MRRLLTALIVFVLAIVLVSPLVDFDDAVAGAPHEHAVNVEFHAGDLADTPIATTTEVSGAGSTSSAPPAISMRC